MLRVSLRVHHKIRDRGGNAHNFAFDTLTTVYRDAVYAKDKRYTGNPMSLKDDKAPTATSTSCSTTTTDSSLTPPRMEKQFTQIHLKGNERVSGSTVSSRSSTTEVCRGQRRSGVQMEILRLYRDLLREVQRMKDPQTRANLHHFIRSDFDENATIPRKFVTRIEWQLHHGKNKLEELRSMRPNTKFSLMR